MNLEFFALFKTPYLNKGGNGRACVLLTGCDYLHFFGATYSLFIQSQLRICTYVLGSCTKNSAMFDFEVCMYITQQESKEVIRLNHLQFLSDGKNRYQVEYLKLEII